MLEHPTAAHPATPQPAELETRLSLLEKLAQKEDQSGWLRFHDTYGRLLVRVAKGAGLSEADADGVVHQALIDVTERITHYRHDHAQGTFKGWLLAILHRRVREHFLRTIFRKCGEPFVRSTQDDDLVPEQVRQINEEAGALWDHEWQHHVMDTALQRLRACTDARQYQIFYLAAIKEIALPEVSERLGAGRAEIYWVKYHLGRKLAKELRAIEDGR